MLALRDLVALAALGGAVWTFGLWMKLADALFVSEGSEQLVAALKLPFAL